MDGQRSGEIVVPTAWGDALVGFSGDAVVSIAVPGGRSAIGSRRATTVEADAPQAVIDAGQRLSAWFDGVPILVACGAELESWLVAAGVDGFRREASMAMAEIPRGTTVTYADLATLAGRPRAARAAGSTCARNPLPIVVPCHRVLPAFGRGLGSYGPRGSDFKRRLLELEGWNALRSDRPAL